MKLQNKVAIVTGSNGGIGRAIAHRLGLEGARIVLNGRNKVKLDDTLRAFREEGITAIACQGDISSVEDCKDLAKRTIAEFGKIDILVNNAGISAKGLFEDFQSGIFSQLINTNVLGSLYITKASLPYIKRNKGSIVFISSLSGLRGIPHQCPYSLTKMAQTAIAEALRAELYQDRVHVGIVYVGVTQNDPDKKIYFSDGTRHNLENGLSNLADSQDYVAQSVIGLIRRRQFKSAVGWKGKIYYFISRYIPGLLDYTFCNHLDYIEKTDS